MRIEDSPYLNPMTFSFYQNRPAREEEQAGASFSLESSKVQISDEARAAYEAYVIGQTKGTDESENKIRDDFLQYMKESKEANKSKEQRLKELKGKLNQLQGELAKVVGDQQMPEEVKKPKATVLNHQITQVMKEIADLTTALADEKAAESAAG